ncbi:hypothetical protein K491DRAFT_695169 [Lophiostoma macrostomum CBS 122681]|uniref:Uncharacterized protein n=1 Tax=Lophiostoma macrostomum CBS 122681 TaxID=1314788 RepID=A0A6A6T312_9PLEO|nr:hypothetical protein K491DRAFT_695169 [Lophiostoma macrostomum CBS 122681]
MPDDAQVGEQEQSIAGDGEDEEEEKLNEQAREKKSRFREEFGKGLVVAKYPSKVRVGAVERLEGRIGERVRGESVQTHGVP